jgi:phosphoglucomutase
MAASNTTHRKGGPAGSEITGAIQKRANELLENGLAGVERILLSQALSSSTTQTHDFITEYVGDLGRVIDFEAIRGANLKLGVDPLGGARVHYCARIREQYGLNLTVVNENRRPDISFHDAGLGWPHPHGSVIALCHAGADRSQGQVRCCVCLRHRS